MIVIIQDPFVRYNNKIIFIQFYDRMRQKKLIFLWFWRRRRLFLRCDFISGVSD